MLDAKLFNTMMGQQNMPIDSRMVKWDDAPTIDAKMVKWDQPEATEGMSTTDKLLSGVGSGMASGIRALGGGSLLQRIGLPATKEEADALNESLNKTTSGKIGTALGIGALAAPVALVPGANTYAGATALGALTGGALTEGDLAERGKGAAFGAVGGALGKGVGDALGWGAGKILANREAERLAAQTANAQKDAAVRTAQDAGYVIPPADVKPSFINEMLNGFSGKIKTAQVASQKNQDVTNALARKALGIADDQPLTAEALDAFRKQAAQPYREIAGMGEFNAQGATLPKSVAVNEGIDPLLLSQTKTVDAGELVRSWKQNNHDATAYFRAYMRDANPETLAKAQAAKSAAKEIDDFLADALLKAGKGDALDALKEARRQIAKSYTVEKALNTTTGDVSSAVLAKELAKGKPLSGELLTIGQVGQAFPKATQLLKEAPKAVSPLDYMAGLLTGTASGNPMLAAATLVRPGARSMILSKPYQARMLENSYAPGLLDAVLPVLESEAMRRALLTGGMTSGLLTN